MIEPEVFARRVERLRPRLVDYASSWVGQEAEDVVSEAVMRALGRLQDYRDTHGDKALFRWMALITRYVMLEHSERRQYHPVDSGISADAIDAAQPGPDATSEEALTRLQRDVDRRTLIGLMGEANLSQLEWECVQARWCGEETADTAARLNLKPGTVREYVRRAIVRLRDVARTHTLARTRVEIPVE